ncbi:glutamate--tRNA ligase [Streptomyces sp. NRRL F-5123]|uniref:glutamate--tRNA ligase n=1 Tax=Streptomyces sp. NRRL F-5123 TaxID=1463856 RepID=UPI0004E1B3BB|nr:glutamate--tRNA ligase family protein [Streptomyces sp. NRRL F-5123]
MQDRDIVDSWFPADLLPPAHWEQHYGPRELPAQARVTRFAPSPTGSMHLGGLYVATLARDLAHRSGGVYLVRIEDTDKEREVAGAAEEFTRVFGYFGLEPDEGEHGGPWGPYRQSDRAAVYLSYVRELVRDERAYPCFCTPEDLERHAAEQRRTRSPLGYYGRWARCRSLSVREADARIAAGEPYTVRLRCPVGLPGRVRFRDLVRGALTMLDNGNDVVLLKSADATGPRLPTYHLAHVVDDHLMRVNTVVRGDEWISSLPLHHQLHRELGFRPPEYAHIAPLMKLDGGSRRKLSKRKDPESAAGFYVAAGYPAAAVEHYLRGLANSRLTDVPAERALAEELRLSEMGTAGPMVDLARLRALSRDHIASLTPREALAQLGAWAAAHDREVHAALGAHPDLALAAFEMMRRGTGTPRKDLACWSEFRAAYGFCFPELHELVSRPDDARLGGLPEPVVVTLAADMVAGYRHAGPPESWFSVVRAIAVRHGFAPDGHAHRSAPGAYRGSVREVANVLRVCLTGSRRSPDLFQVAQCLGEREVLRRLRPLAEAAVVCAAT